MKTKTLAISAVVVLILGIAAIRFWAERSSVTPPPLTVPSQSTPSADSTGEPTPTPIPTAKSTAPKITLTILSPTNGATVTKSSIKVQGKTLPNADVFVNEKETKADKNGNFSVSMNLDEGENYIIVVANDENGNVAEMELTVTYNSG